MKTEQRNNGASILVSWTEDEMNLVRKLMERDGYHLQSMQSSKDRGRAHAKAAFLYLAGEIPQAPDSTPIDQIQMEILFNEVDKWIDQPIR